MDDAVVLKVIFRTQKNSAEAALFSLKQSLQTFSV